MLKKIMYSITENIDKDIKQRELASAINKSEARISKFFNEDIDLYFPDMLLAIRKLSPHKEDELIKKCIDYYLEDMNILPYNVKCILDYYYNKINVSGIEHVLNKIDTINNREIKDWKNLYEIAINYLVANNKEDFVKINKQLENYIPKYPETKIFKDILTSYVYYKLKYYNHFFEKASALTESIETLKDGYMKESLTAKLYEILSNAYLYFKGDTEKARYFAEKVQESDYICAKFKFNTYYIIGTSYFFEDYKKSIDHLHKYIELMNSIGRKERSEKVLNEDVMFVHSFWSNDRSIVNSTNEFINGYFEAKRGNRERAVQIVSELPDNPFKKCVLGIANKDITYLYEAAIEYIERGDKHMAKLPKIEIEKIKMEKGEVLK